MAVLVCCKKEELSYYVDELVIDTESCIAEGSYVLGSELNEYCKVTIPYENGHGGKAVLSAPRTNGMEIAPMEFEVADGSGSVTANVTGRPISIENSFLQIEIEYEGQKYISSVEIPVLEDLDPNGTVEFTIPTDPIVSLTEAKTLDFTVNPTMASVVVSFAPDGLATSISSDPETGKGTLTLTPTGSFLSGEIEITATFGARPVQTETISLNAFADGEGTEASPYIISTAAEFAKVAYGLDKAFKLSADIDLGTNWTPAGTAENPFNGTIDADNHAVTLNINRPDEDYVGLFGHIGPDAVITDLTIKGSVTGNDYVAALAAYSDADITANTDDATVTGANHVAAAIASGSAKDDTVIEFGENVVTAVNIVMGTTQTSGKLGLVSAGPDIVFDPGQTGSEWSYDKGTDEYTVTKGDSHVDGTVAFHAEIGENVRSTEHSISLTSKKMYESGTGTEGDPYIVIDADQFAATLSTYSSAWVKLTQNITVSNWSTIEEFSGNLDGDGHVVSGLNAPFAATLSGTVQNIKFRDVNITAWTNSACGPIAGTVSGTIRNTAVTGTLTAVSAANNDETGLGGIAGEATGKAIIDNCYVKLDITSNNKYANGGLVGKIKTSEAITMSNSTVEGTITATSGGTKTGGILGRKTSNSQNSTDIIKGCLVTATINTNSSANMVGGIFGAMGGDKGISIEQSAFTGSVSAGSNVGGIGAACCPVTDCYVSGSVQSTQSNNTAGAGGIAAAVKGNVTRCVVYNARITGQPFDNASYTAGIVNRKNGNGSRSVTKCAVINTQIEEGGFTIYGTASADITCSDNYWWGVTYASNGAAYTPITGTDTYGQDGTQREPAQDFFESLGYDFTDVWSWDSTAGAPVLKKVGCDDSVKL